MSGGHFEYRQMHIEMIVEELEQIVARQGCKPDDWDYSREWNAEENDYSAETYEEFRKGITILRKAYVYARRIDWLLSGDDGEDSFHQRLHDELKELK